MAELSPTPAPYVFLSYTSADRERVLLLADALEETGISVWVDRRDLVGGSSWNASIVDAISHCTAFALTCSARSLSSPNVQQEVQLAWEEQRPILPLLLEPAPMPRELRYPLAGRQWVELLDRPQDAWLSDVLRALASLGLVPATPAVGALPGAVPATERPPTNLPTSLTSFLGREQELADLAQLLAHTRLVTLTGPGGTGKTRLALSAAAAQLAAFPDGVFFVDLAPLQDPMLVPSAVAQVLSLQGSQDLPLRDNVLRFIRDKRLLLVLDNYEHLLDAAEFAGALLQAGPAATLLVTSRAPLRVTGEREYAVAPLLVPAAGSHSTAELGQNPAVQLFVLRAQAVRADFVLTAEIAPTVAAICMRLDGLPLAIELGAARLRALPPTALLARLEQRLPLLTGGARDVPARQQTLRGAISWSYDLLEPAEQRLFRRLGVFAGGCTLELAEAVCNADGDRGLDVLDGVSSLVEKSLLREADGLAGEPRFRMLETIREFALGELEASGEAEALRRRHAANVLAFAEQADVRLRGPELGPWLEHIELEHANVRASLQWSQSPNGDRRVGLRLAGAMALFWRMGGHVAEGLDWLMTALTAANAVPIAERYPQSGNFPFRSVLPRVTALNGAGLLAEAHGALALAQRLLEESLTLARQADDRSGMGWALNGLGRVASNTGDARTHYRESVAQFTAVGDDDGKAFSLYGLANNLVRMGNQDGRAEALYAESVALFRVVGDGWGLSAALAWWAALPRRAGEQRRAAARSAESLALARDLRLGWVTALCLRGIAAAVVQRLPEHACRVLAAAQGLFEKLGIVMGPIDQAEDERTRAAAQTELGESRFAALWEAGRALPLEQAIAEGLLAAAAIVASTAPPTSGPPRCG